MNVSTTIRRMPTAGPREFLFTSESVTEGHPDKVADQISDGVLDEVLRRDTGAMVACEVLVTTGLVVVAGEITTDAYVDIPRVVRNTVRDIGYTDAAFGFDFLTCGVVVAIDEQSPDIRMGIALLVRGAAPPGRRRRRRPGSRRPGHDVRLRLRRDPGADAAPDHARAPHRPADGGGAQGRHRWRYLRPDGKSQVTVRYRQSEGRLTPIAVERLLVSTQHDPDVDEATIRRGLLEHVLPGVMPEELCPQARLAEPDFLLVNPTGRFVTGGPMGDTGVTGRKIIVDTYGGSARHGGGAFSGKDPSKVDRSGSYAMRWVAKNIVAAGLAARAEVQVAYAIGVAHPVSVGVETFDTETVPRETIESAVASTSSTCARPRSSASSTCSGRSTSARPPAAISAASTRTSPGSARTASRSCAPRAAWVSPSASDTAPVASVVPLVTARAVDRAFDYAVPAELDGQVSRGSRGARSSSARGASAAS